MSCRRSSSTATSDVAQYQSVINNISKLNNSFLYFKPNETKIIDLTNNATCCLAFEKHYIDGIPFDYTVKRLINSDNFLRDFCTLYDVFNNHHRKANYYQDIQSNKRKFTKNHKSIKTIKEVISRCVEYDGFRDVTFEGCNFTLCSYVVESSEMERIKNQYVLYDRDDEELFNNVFDKYIDECIKYVGDFISGIVEKSLNGDNDVTMYRLEVSDSYAEWTQINKTVCGRSIESVYLPSKEKNELIGIIDDFLKPETVEFYKKRGVSHTLPILLYGISGTGKTSIIRAIANNYGMNIGMMSLSDPQLNDNKLADAFNHIPSNTIVVLEEIDASFTKERESKNHNTVTFASLLNLIGGIAEFDRQIIIATTNHKEQIDPALNRRFTFSMEFNYIQPTEILAMISNFRENDDEEKIKDLATAFNDYFKNTTPAFLQQLLMFYRKLDIDSIIKLIKTNKISNIIKTERNSVYSNKMKESADNLYL